MSNYEDSYLGAASLWSATAASDNSVFAELGMEVKPKRVARLANRMGIRTELSTNPAMLLGGLEQGVTPLEMAYAYSTIANDGVRVSGTLAPNSTGPVAFEEVDSDRRGIEAENDVVRERVFPADVGQLAKEMLHLVVTSGTGKSALVGDEYIWGKTGTTENYGDAWFAGGNEDLSVAIWVGYADRLQPMEYEHAGGPVAGGTFPAEIFHDFMTSWLTMREEREAARAARKDDDDEGDESTLPAVPVTPSGPLHRAARAGRDDSRGPGSGRGHGWRGGARRTARGGARSTGAHAGPRTHARAGSHHPADHRRGHGWRHRGGPGRQSLGGAARPHRRGPGTRDVAAVRVAEAPRQVDRLRDPDALAEHDPRRSRSGLARMQLDRPVEQRAAVQRQADVERLGQLAGSRAQVLGALEPAPLPHQLDSLDRLECPDQHRGADALLLGDGVQKRVHAVGEVHVGPPGRAEERARPVRDPGVGVAGRLVHVVALGLDDAPGRARVPERAAHEVARDVVDRARVEGALEPQASASARTCRAWASWSRTRASAVPPVETFDSSQAPCSSSS